jgi:DNA excision repair protein ERCC-4
MLKFQREILEEVVKEDGLLILSSGLGLFQLFGSLVQLYVGGKHLVLIINSTQEEDQLLHEQLKWNGVSAKDNMKRIVYNTLAETRFCSLFVYIKSSVTYMHIGATCIDKVVSFQLLRES